MHLWVVLKPRTKDKLLHSLHTKLDEEYNSKYIPNILWMNKAYLKGTETHLMFHISDLQVAVCEQQLKPIMKVLRLFGICANSKND